MRRTVTAGLLLICLGIFLCPAAGKQEPLVEPAKKSSCCAQKSAYEQMSERLPDGKGCASERSQSNSSCPVPCSALVLFCPPLQPRFAPAQTEELIFASDTFASARTDRPPVPPPRV
jgi:hypothetical protein